MSDLAALHAQARRLTLSIRGGLDRLEAFEAVRAGTGHVATHCLRVIGKLSMGITWLIGEYPVLRRPEEERTMLRWRRKCSRSLPTCRPVSVGLVNLPQHDAGLSSGSFGHTINNDANMFWAQSTSVQMDSIWRMQVVRENATKRDIWKRCYANLFCCSANLLTSGAPLTCGVRCAQEGGAGLGGN